MSSWGAQLAYTQIGHEPLWCCEYLRYLFAYTGLVWNLPQSRLCDYTVKCKGCGENIPAPVQTMPDTWVVAGVSSV